MVIATFEFDEFLVELHCQENDVYKVVAYEINNESKDIYRLQVFDEIPSAWNKFSQLVASVV